STRNGSTVITVRTTVVKQVPIGADQRMRDRKQDIISRLLDTCGRTFADELNIRVKRDTPSEWFKLLVYVLLSSRRIGKQLSLRAAREIFKEGWTTPQRMAKTTW